MTAESEPSEPSAPSEPERAAQDSPGSVPPSPSSPSRRRFLRTGLFGAAILAVGGVGLALYPSKEVAPPTAPLVALAPRSFQVLVAVAARIVTARGASPVAVAHGVDRSLSYALPETQRQVGDLLGLLENALPGLLLDGHVLPFTRLSPESQDAVLERWRTSRIALRRVGYQALRKLVLAAYYMEEASWRPLDYQPPSGLNAMAFDDSKLGTPEWGRAQAGGEAP